MKKLSILHIITKLELGGAQKSALNIVTILDKTRYNLALISSDQGLLLSEAYQIPEVTVKTFPTLKRAIDPLKDLVGLIRLTIYIREKKFDLVHTHSSKAGILGRWAARLAGVPVIVHTIHGWEFHKWQNPVTRALYITLERLTAKITHQLIAVCASDIQKGLRSGIGSKDKYTLVRYGIPIQKFTNLKVNRKNKREQLGLNGAPVVGMVACFKPQKAPQDFLKTAAEVKKALPQTKFLLVGDGALRPKLENLSQRLKLQNDLIFAGWRRDIPEIMSALDILVLTSLWEGSPIVLLEAMASSLPVVATSTAGTDETITQGKNGFLVSCGDTSALAQKIISLLKNKPLAVKMGQQGRRQLGPGFEVKHMVEQIDQLYQRLAKTYRLC